MAKTITIPDFNFSAFYYGQILDALIEFKRTNAPELTDESEYEPTIQLLRAFALVGHLNNTTLDLVANESTLPTAKLVETVRNMLRLIDYEMSPASPAQTDIVYKLGKVFATSYEIIRPYSQAATKKQGDDPAIYFEALEPLTVSPTNAFTKVFAQESGIFTDYTSDANNQLSGNSFLPWATPETNDMLYFGHDTAMWDVLRMNFQTSVADMYGVWEYRESEWRRTAPTSVTATSQLAVDLTTLLGTVDRSGMSVRVQLNSTGAWEDGDVSWNGSYNTVTVGLLGQSSPSSDPSAYTVGAEWLPIDGALDGTNNWDQDGDVEYVLPQDNKVNWIKTVINGVKAYYLRYRIITAPASPPEIDFARMDTGGQYVLRLATQGRAFTQDPLGSSTGLPDQTFETSKDNFVWGSEVVTIDGEIWTRVGNFLGSESGDKHYVIRLGENDRATVLTGNGASGKVPPAGASNVAITYRYGSNDDGNVGAKTVTVDKTGLSFVNNLWNPRQANGWQEAQGASEESLAKAKIEGPASIRAKDVALGPDDVEQMTVQYEENGARPYVRARSFEEGFGPKTVEVVVVPAGGGLATQEQLNALELFFNGNRNTVPKSVKRIVANQEVGAVNYIPHPIDVTATVYGDVTPEEIEASLITLLHPEALKDDGVTWLWQFGGIVPSSRISHEIFETNASITKVTQTTPPINIDTQLATRELPTIGSIILTIIKPS
jgi:hypothetical protein